MLSPCEDKDWIANILKVKKLDWDLNWNSNCFFIGKYVSWVHGSYGPGNSWSTVDQPWLAARSSPEQGCAGAAGHGFSPWCYGEEEEATGVLIGGGMRQRRRWLGPVAEQAAAAGIARWGRLSSRGRRNGRQVSDQWCMERLRAPYIGRGRPWVGKSTDGHWWAPLKPLCASFTCGEEKRREGKRWGGGAGSILRVEGRRRCTERHAPARRLVAGDGGGAIWVWPEEEDKGPGRVGR
jgi:hypothetical protein